MNYDLFNQIVSNHKNSLLIMGIITLICAIVAVLIVEIYVRGSLGIRYFNLFKIKFSPTLLLLPVIALILIIYSIKIYQCNSDMINQSYEEYVGNIEYTASSVKFDNGLNVFVGKGNDIVPYGRHYGRVILSSKAKVIVSFEPIDNNSTAFE